MHSESGLLYLISNSALPNSHEQGASQSYAVRLLLEWRTRGVAKKRPWQVLGRATEAHKGIHRLQIITLTTIAQLH